MATGLDPSRGSPLSSHKLKTLKFKLCYKVVRTSIKDYTVEPRNEGVGIGDTLVPLFPFPAIFGPRKVHFMNILTPLAGIVHDTVPQMSISDRDNKVQT